MWKYNSALDEYIEVDQEDSPSSISLKNLQRLNEEKPHINVDSQTRIIYKSGKINTLRSHRQKIKWPLRLKELGYTLLTTKWRWIWITVVLVNFVCFAFFGLLWMWIAHVSGDFEHGNSRPCVVNTKSFTGYMLLSIETITTIGYGYRFPTENCNYGWVVLTFQALCSVALQGALVSAIYAKTAKPSIKVFDSLFSKTAVICQRDGKLSFIFRIHDYNSKIWCGTSISLYFVDKRKLMQSEDVDNEETAIIDRTYRLTQMKLNPHGLLIFPLEIEHVIDEDSPLWELKPADMASNTYEIIAVAEGSSIITGQVSQNRTSYNFMDIYWGCNFEPCLSFNESFCSYEVNYKLLKRIVPVDTPWCSAKELKEIQKLDQETD